MGANPWSYLDAPVLDRLDMASVLVRDVLDTPYLVGSCLTKPDYRDVDIRVILLDERYDELFKRPHADPLRHLIQVAITDHYVKETGLRIDFQIQRMTEANEQYSTEKGGTRRHPLGIYPWPYVPDSSEITLTRIRETLENYPQPKCRKHPKDRPIKCGWKSAIEDIRKILEAHS